MSDDISKLITTEQRQRDLINGDALEMLAGFNDTCSYLASIPSMIAVNLLKAYPMPDDVWQLQQTNGYRVKCAICDARLIDRRGPDLKKQQGALRRVCGAVKHAPFLECGHLALYQLSCGRWVHQHCYQPDRECDCCKPQCSGKQQCFWC